MQQHRHLVSFVVGMLACNADDHMLAHCCLYDGCRLVCRFVRWSDGSLQLLVGDEVLDVSELDVERDNSYLFLRHVQVQFLEVCHRSSTDAL